jgi:basic membrane protein A
MKKQSALVVSAIMILSLLFSACEGSGAAAGASTPPAPPESTPPESTGGEPEGTADAAGKPGEGKRIALVCDVAGTQVFVLSMIDGLNEAAREYGFEAIVAECADSAAYEDNIRALVEENTDLIIVGGWQGGDALNKIATEFPDRADYALIDSEVEAENVKCISYREQEGAYLIGKIAAHVVDEGENIFGGVHVNQGPGSWKWRYGFMEGVKSINPDATFVFNYTGDYNDPAKAKEYALLQYEQGARFINAAAAGGDIGVFEAALEKLFYTSGQDVDLTDPGNPYIVSSQIKDTGATVKYMVNNYLTEGWNYDNETWGIAEGTIGAVHVTHDSPNPISDRLAGEKLADVVQAAEDIRTGKMDMSNMPAEEDYQ